jgi:hypothetical protein
MTTMMRRCVGLVLVSVLLGAGLLSGQQPDLVARIRTEGQQRSSALALYRTLTDEIGARLTGSPAHLQAARWARDRFAEWGLTNTHLEPFDFGRGWQLERVSVEMTEPRYVPLVAYADAWSPSTAGVLSGRAVYIGDNVMEAMRILRAIGAEPRRTIRVALWSGEEQGLLGARAHVAQHYATPAARNQLAVYLNDDPGSGRTLGFYMEGNTEAKALFDRWLAPLTDLGATRNVIEGIGSTDHVPFNQAGMPGFNAIKDFTAYDERTRHTNADYPERMTDETLKQSAIVMATFAWQAAMADETIPRTPAK